MKKSINFAFLKHAKKLAIQNQDHIMVSVYKKCYAKLFQIIKDIKKPYYNIAVHGYFPNLMFTQPTDPFGILGTLQQHFLKNKSKQDSHMKITFFDCFREEQEYKSEPIIHQCLWTEQLTNQASLNTSIGITTTVQFKHLFSNNIWVDESERFDLILSCLELHHCDSWEEFLGKYHRSLKEDGTLIGIVPSADTFSKLKWAYIMAENQRHGGLSPKISNFHSVGEIGHFLTINHYTLCTLLPESVELELESPMEIYEFLRLMGENGYLKGRRKGVYKDLLLATLALYQSEFAEGGKIIENVELTSFIGWRFSPTQPKPMRRGANLASAGKKQKISEDNVGFIEDLRKHDSSLKVYKVTQGLDEPEQLQ